MQSLIYFYEDLKGVLKVSFCLQKLSWKNKNEVQLVSAFDGLSSLFLQILTC